MWHSCTSLNRVTWPKYWLKVKVKTYFHQKATINFPELFPGHSGAKRYLFMSVLSNMRPAGHMRPAGTFYLARGGPLKKSKLCKYVVCVLQFGCSNFYTNNASKLAILSSNAHSALDLVARQPKKVGQHWFMLCVTWLDRCQRIRLRVSDSDDQRSIFPNINTCGFCY